jgi:hypothetical protein
MSKISKWKYIKIELEILGKVTEVRFVQQKDYLRILNLFIAYGKTQPDEWAVFIKRHNPPKTIYQRTWRNKVSKEKRRLDKIAKLKTTNTV